jgi:hypothetical protein
MPARVKYERQSLPAAAFDVRPRLQSEAVP